MFNYHQDEAARFGARGPPSHHRHGVAPAQGRDFVLREVRQNRFDPNRAVCWYPADREVVLAAVQQSGGALQYAARPLRADREVVLAAVQQSGGALLHAARDFGADREVMLAAVQQDGEALLYAGKKLRTNRRVVLAAVQQFGGALRHAAPKLKADREIVLAAVQEFGGALGHAAPELRADKEVVLAAVKQHGLSFENDWNQGAFRHRGYLQHHNPLFYASELLADRGFLVEVLKLGGRFFDHLPAELRDDEALKLLAIRYSPLYKKRFPELVGPAESAIAFKGEACPTVFAALASCRVDGDGWDDQFGIAFEVSLLSGRSFTCHLDGPNLKVNDLAKEIVKNWPPEADGVDHVFIVIVRRDGAEDEGGDYLQITPWDYNTPLADCLQLRA